MDVNYEIITCEGHQHAKLHVIKGSQLAKLALREERIPAHWHRSIEMTLVVHGCMNAWIDGEVHLIQEDFNFVNSGAIHELQRQDQGYPDVIILIISYDYLKQTIDDFDAIRFDLQQELPSKRRMRALFHQLADLQKEASSISYLMMNSLIDELLYLLMRDYRVNLPTGKRQTIAQQQTRAMIDVIQQQYRQPLDLAAVAAQFAMCKEYFSAQFHKRVGVSFYTYLTQVRLHGAYQELLHTDKTIQQLAMDHGFPNVKAFIDAFKAEYHLTPNQYRKTSKELTIPS